VAGCADDDCAQAEALGPPLRTVALPWPCPNDVYRDRVLSGSPHEDVASLPVTINCGQLGSAGTGVSDTTVTTN
jgi:hypothetical protein